MRDHLAQQGFHPGTSSIATQTLPLNRETNNRHVAVLYDHDINPIRLDTPNLTEIRYDDCQTKRSELQEEIRDLRQCNRDLLLRVENLEGKSGEWTSREAHQTAPLSDVMALTATVADELQSRKDKDQNLVIYGLREITEDRDSTVNEESEKDAVCELLTHLQVPSPNISTVFRMGRRSPGRPRPVKVFCGNPETREVALRNSRKLKDLPSSHKFRNVFIRAYLTKLQRDQTRSAAIRDSMHQEAQHLQLINLVGSQGQVPTGLTAGNTNCMFNYLRKTLRETRNREVHPPPKSSVLYFNGRSLCNKQTELRDTINFYNCDIVGICETWLNPSYKLTAFGSQYQVFRQDRSCSNGGGVLLAVKNNLTCRLVKAISDGRCECIFVDVRCSKSEFSRYGMIYRPPDCSLEDSPRLYGVILESVKNSQLYMPLGDFNLSDIVWDNLTTRSQTSREFLTLCFKLGAEQCVNFPTRGTNLLHLVLTSNKCLIKKKSRQSWVSVQATMYLYCVI